MRKILILFLCAPFVYQGVADTVTLKSGEKLDGKILNETDAQVTVRVQVSSSITDERTIEKTDVASIEKEQPDEIAFEGIKSLKPDPRSSYALETYDRILDSLKHFLKTFPESPHRAEVQANLDAFEKEQTQVAAGQIKFLGQWISKEQAEKRRIQIQAQHFLGTMRQQAASGDIVNALNSFDTFEKSFATSRVYPDAIDLAKQLLPRLQQYLGAQAKTLAYQQQQLQVNLSRTTEPQRSQIIAAEKRNQAGYDAALAAAQKSGLKWMPFIPGSSKSISALQTAIPSEIQRLAQLPVSKMRSSIANVDDARAKLAGKDYDGADASLKIALAQWPMNEDATFYTGEVKAARPTPTPSASPSLAPPKPAAKHVSTSDEDAQKAAAEAGSRSFFMTLPGVLTVVGVIVVVFGAIKIVGRMQAQKDVSK